MFVEQPLASPGSANKSFLHHKYTLKGLYKEFTILGLSLAFLWNNEVGSTCKTCILTALKSASKIINIECLKLLLGNFLIQTGVFQAYYNIFQFSKQIAHKICNLSMHCNQIFQLERVKFNILKSKICFARPILKKKNIQRLQVIRICGEPLTATITFCKK